MNGWDCLATFFICVAATLIAGEVRAALVMRIERGEFDVPQQIPMGLDHIGFMNAAASKDAEIARLKEEVEKGDYIIEKETRRSTEFEKGAKERILGLQEEIARLNGVIKQITHCHCELQREMLRQRDRIKELEKLTALQNETIDAHWKALREARMEESAAWMKALKDTLEIGLPDQQHVLDRVLLFVKEFDRHKPSAQKEPELFICPTVGAIPNCSDCDASRPHRHSVACDVGPDNPDNIAHCPKCIPVKSTVPTSGTGTAPEGATVDRARSGMLDDEHCVCDACILDSGIPSECGHDPEECKTIALGHAYPGMAKDIGDLTLRVDNLESKLDSHLLGKDPLEERVESLEKETKDQREDYHAHIRQFVEENATAHKETNKALKALQEAVQK